MRRTDCYTANWVVGFYMLGHTMKAIAKMFSISTSTVLRILRDCGVQARVRAGVNTLPKETIVEMYKSGKSTTEIADQYAVSSSTIINVLSACNIERNNRYHNLSLNLQYWKSIDSFDKAYFLGFVVADGNIFENMFRLQLSIKDMHILEIFSKYTCNSNKISISDRKEKGKFASFNCKCSEWVSDLAQFGVVPRKNFTVPMPQIREDLMSHMIRGLFDGNGWISPNGRQIGYCGNEFIVPQLRDYLVKTLNVYNVKILRTQPHLWQICWCSKHDIEIICEYLYHDKHDCYLKRKYDNYCKLITR